MLDEVRPLSDRLTARYLEEHRFIPLELRDDCVVVAAAEPLPPDVTGEVATLFNRPVRIVPASLAEIERAIERTYGAGGASVADVLDDLREDGLELVAEASDSPDDLADLANQAPVIRLVNLILRDALQKRASDVHLDAMPDALRVRYRVDGVLHDVSSSPKRYHAAVVSRIKVMANMDIAERRLPQDGRIRLRMAEREVDLRVSTIPTVHGESVVLRILDRSSATPGLELLGMLPEDLGRFTRLIRRPHGILLVTGPTGSGKTTTLYTALSQLNDATRKIITVEDPVEYQLRGVSQIEVHSRIGLSFAAALRSILRQDPDIIMVGEIRDRETAEIAVQAALTGHLVLSTLHTNDAPTAVTRLLDMGVEDYLVASTVEGIIAQRLVRRICPECAAPYQPEGDVLARMGLPPGTRLRHGAGCRACDGTGYRGRLGIYEILILSDQIRALVVRRTPLEEIRSVAVAEGMKTLRMDGVQKVLAGETTLEEVLRVTAEVEE
ncbi:MAG TPA: type II secretion system ATPase GspE [Longimicrobiaceae bacterium]|nr:type II secretion system ATPase GspE [Longimicrobiaceae bacterium]